MSYKLRSIVSAALLSVAGTVGFSVPSYAQSASECAVFAIQDTDKQMSDYHLWEEVKRTVKRHETGNISSASADGFKAGFPVPVGEALLNVDLEGHSSSSDFRSWLNAFYRSDYRLFKQSFRSESMRSWLSDNATEVIKECLKKPGPVGSLQIAANKNAVKITVRYVPYRTQEVAKLTRVQVPGNPACERC